MPSPNPHLTSYQRYALLWRDPPFQVAYFIQFQRQSRFSRGVVRDGTSPFVFRLNRPQNGYRWRSHPLLA